LVEECLDLFEIIPVFESLPRYPAVERDLALIVDEGQAVGELTAYLKELGGELLQTVVPFDVYAGQPIHRARKALLSPFGSKQRGL